MSGEEGWASTEQGPVHSLLGMPAGETVQVRTEPDRVK